MRALTHLDRLEAESIHIMREAVAECEKPVMLYSIGKDSSVMLHLALKAFHPVEAAVPAAARGHHVEVPRDDRVPRPHRARARPRAHRARQSGSPRARHRPVHPRLGGAHRRVEDAGPEAGARSLRLRRGLRRRAPGRGEVAREGAHLLVSLRTASVGPEAAAPGALAPLQRAHEPRREHARVPAVELDRARRLAVHPARGHRRGAALFRAAAAGGGARAAR